MITYFEEVPDTYLKLADGLVRTDKKESSTAAKSYLKLAKNQYISNHVTQRASLKYSQDTALLELVDLKELAYTLKETYSADRPGSFYVKIEVYAKKNK